MECMNMKSLCVIFRIALKLITLLPVDNIRGNSFCKNKKGQPVKRLLSEVPDRLIIEYY